MDKKRFLAFTGTLFVLTLVGLTSSVTALTESEFCKSGDLSTTCTVSNDALLADGDTFNGNDLVVDAGLSSSGNYTLNFSGSVTFQSNAYLDGGGDIYANKFENFQNLELRKGTGNAYLCERNGATTCEASKGDVKLDTEFNLTDNRFLYRQINDEWNQGYLNWTENVSRINELNSSFTELEAYYTASGLLENQEYRIVEDSTTINEVDSNVNFSKVVWDNFAPVESKNVTVSDSVLLEASSIIESSGNNIGSETNLEKTYVGMDFIPQEQKRISEILLWSSRSETIDYYIKNKSSGNTILTGSYGHDGTGWESDQVEKLTVDTGTTFEMGINPGSKIYYYAGIFGNKNGIKWEQGDVTNSFQAPTFMVNVGLGTVSGYKPKGYMTTRPLDAEKTVEWNKTEIKESIPQDTSISYQFGTNESGTWNYYNNIENVPDSRFLKSNITLSTDKDSVTPSLDTLNAVYNPDGRDGLIEITNIVSNKERIEILETTNPEITGLTQSDLISVENTNTLSADVIESSSGLDRVILQTNETGNAENKTEYSINFNGELNTQNIEFAWKNDSYNSLETIEWKIWAKDIAGTWSSSNTKRFDVDGAPPNIQTPAYQEVLDIDNKPALISAQISDDETSVVSVKIEENYRGTPENSSMNYSERFDEYQKEISPSSPSEVDFTIYAEDESGNVETASGTISFQDIDLNPSISDSTVNNSESFEVSGEGSLLPYGNDVTSDIEFWASTGSNWQLLGTDSPSSGQFSLSTSLSDSGSYEIKTNTSNSDNIYGEASTFIDVLLNIKEASTVFEDTGNTHLDVDTSPKNVNLSANIDKPQDTSISLVQASITGPEGRNKELNLTEISDTRTWDKKGDIEPKFGNTLGEYDVIFAANTANDKDGLGSNVVERTFTVENISVDSTLERENISVGQSTALSGNVILEPFDTVVDSESLTVTPEGKDSKNFDVNNGDYSGQINFSTPGNKTVGLDITDSNGITGANSTEVHVFNLSADILSATGDDGIIVYRDSTDDIDIEFKDNVSSSPENPVALKDISASYNVPNSWVGSASNIGTLEPGENSSSNPRFNVPPTADLGEKNVDLNAESSNGITDSDNFTVEVWTKSDSSFIGEINTINRNLDDYTILANITDSITGEPLTNVKTSLSIGDTSFQNTSNITGEVKFNINVSDFGTGDYSAILQSVESPEAFTSPISGDTSFTTVSIQGVMQEQNETEINTVYRDGSSGSTTTYISGQILDSTGDKLENVDLSADLNGKTIGTDQTNQKGAYTFPYSPETGVEPGKYNATITATKSEFEDFVFNRTVEVRGVLDITNNFDKNTIGRGLSHSASSTVLNDFGTEVSGDVEWRLNDTKVGEGYSTLLDVPEDFETGYYDLEASTNRSSFDDDSDTVGVDVYGQASVDLKPDDFTIRPGNSISLEASVTDENSSEGINSYPVEFQIDDGNSIRTVERFTNSSGVATFEWSPDQGSYDVEASIEDNSSLYYNATGGSDVTEAFIGDKMYLDDFSFQNNPIYRFSAKSPDSTLVNITLTETSNTINRVPVSEETVNFEVNGSDTFSCTTDTDGYCDVEYNPSSAVTPGNLDVVASTDRSGWIDVNRTEKLEVIGFLKASLDNPSSDDNLARGDVINLRGFTETLVPNDFVKQNLTWRLLDRDGSNMKTIANGYDTNWNISQDQATGPKKLKINATGEYFEGFNTDDRRYKTNIDVKDVWILGKASPEIQSPDNSSALGYEESKDITCRVKSNAGVSIEDYPVEFFDNSSGTFENKKTVSEGSRTYAEASWELPDEVTTLEAGCRIVTNRTLGYTAEERTSTRIFQTKDDKPPEISNIELPTRIDPGKTASISFNASDESGTVSKDSIDYEVVVGIAEITEGISLEKTGTKSYSLNIDTQDTDGTYSVDIYVRDSVGNTNREKNLEFNVRPGGLLNIDNEVINADNVTFNEGYAEEVTARFEKLNRTGYNLKINASTDDSDITFNQTEYNCGQIEAGNYCNKTFKVMVDNATSANLRSGSEATFSAFWDKTSDNNEDIATVGNTTEVNIAPNPVLAETEGNKTNSKLKHGSTGNLEFRLNSSGNEPIREYNTGYQEYNLLSEWVNFTGNSIDEIESNNTDTNIQMEVNIPEGTPPGDYYGNVVFESSNYQDITRNVSIFVKKDESVSIPDEINASAVKGSQGVLKTINFNSTGNIDLELSHYFSGNTGGVVEGKCKQDNNIRPLNSPINLPRQESKEVSLVYNFSGVDFDESTQRCEPIISFGDEEEDFNESRTLNIDLVDFTLSGSAQTGEALPGDTRSLSFTPEIGGSVTTDNIEYDIFVNGTEASVVSNSSDSSGFDVDYTVPEIPDARVHDVEVLARDTSRGVSQRKVFKDAIDVPDVTVPEFGEFDILGVSPGDDLTIEVPVTDNNLAGVSSVSMNVTGPNMSKELTLTENGEKWRTTLDNLSKGLYDLNFTAVDPVGLETNTVDRFRVSNGTTFDGNFTDSAGNGIEASLTISDSNTGRTLSRNIDNSGSYSFNNLRSGNYNIEASFQNQRINLNNANVDSDNLSLRAEKLTGSDLSGLTPTNITNERIMGIGVETDLNPDSSKIQFNYSNEDIPSDYDIEDLKIARCGDYNYESLRCESSTFELIDIGTFDVNKGLNLITVDIDGFSSYTLFAPVEQQQTEEEEEDTSSSSGGGGGGLTQEDLNQINDTVSETQEEVENLSGRLNDSQTGAELGSSTINAELRPGESMQTSLTVSNTLDKSQTFIFNVDDSIDKYVNVTNSLTLEASDSEDVILSISVPQDELSGSYTGSLSVQSSEINTEIPVNIQVTPPQDKLLDLSVKPVFSTVQPGETLQLEASFSNQGYARNVDVTADFVVIDPDSNGTVASIEQTVAVGTTLNRIFELQIPEDTELKSYAVRGTARYTNIDVARVATASSSFTVDLPFWSRTFLGFTYGNIGLGFLIFLLTSTAGIGIYNYRRKKALEKKRYMEKIDMSTIPTGGSMQAYLGQLAEIGTRTFMKLDDLTTHALIAGATGSGKTVTGQVMVEEALDKGANVIVLDPTAQWTGYLRENEDPEMKELYEKYGLSKSDARAYDGNIRAVEPGDEIDITPYLEQDEDGQIIIFSLHKLDSKNIDEFANKTIQQIFDANLPERNGLETVIVYDEVHRLLEKFGGNGEGLKQLERGAREFRKWGVGMVLLSQVISDFSGEIRANIGTTVQMRTQYDDDLDRIKNKFGLDTVKSIAKAEVGSGMLQSSDYNHGRPYFIDFRPLLHSPHRLSDEELEKYEDYNKRIDRVEARVNELEEQGEEVYEYRSELKLTKRNLKKGSFTLVDTYIDELEEKLDM